MHNLWARHGRLLGQVLQARAAVLTVCAIVLGGIAFLFLCVQRELAPGEDQGYVFVPAKAPQYANVTYSERTARDIQSVFEKLPDYQDSFFANGMGGQNNGFGGVVLKPRETAR